MQRDVYNAIIDCKAVCESSLWSSEWKSGQRQLAGQAAYSTFKSACIGCY